MQAVVATTPRADFEVGAASCAICEEGLTTSESADLGFRMAKRGDGIHNVHERCFQDRGESWMRAA